MSPNSIDRRGHHKSSKYSNCRLWSFFKIVQIKYLSSGYIWGRMRAGHESELGIGCESLLKRSQPVSSVQGVTRRLRRQDNQKITSTYLHWFIEGGDRRLVFITDMPKYHKCLFWKFQAPSSQPCHTSFTMGKNSIVLDLDSLTIASAS